MIKGRHAYDSLASTVCDIDILSSKFRLEHAIAGE